ncbi:Thioredoxin-related protein [Shimia gijangensis]|uniref:Thioredoxin-related protein n=1 Tax=Shimia gijangensis TaxID=1470563 RepID=A0A1M6P2C6_9RHOB|nr:thioredoxin family protein [Shimia gijangensis]SHK02068.1 Thioredoxin-related protein [Shimia gijangensis]
MKRWILTLVAAVMTAGMTVPVLAAELGDDGLHKTEWFRDTFKDLQEDYEEAKAEGKQLLIIVEQRGCIYCQDMHEDAFTHPRVLAHLTDTYYPVQLDLHGANEMTDTDGESLEEREAARKWGVMFTPTMIFLPPEIDFSKPAIRQAVAVMPGAFKSGTTGDMMTWVAEERYLDQSEEDFQRYHARMIRERNDGDTH